MTDIAKLQPFPLRVDHQFDEPAHAYLLRTVAHNGSSHFYKVYERVGVLWGRSVSYVDVDLVAHLCHADPEALRHASPDRTEDGIAVLGQVIRHEHFSDLKRRWCPHCLAETPYHRVWWDIIAITTCPIHEVDLVSDCGCDNKLAHGRHAVTQCRKGHDLRKVDAVPADPQRLSFDRYLLDRMLDRSGHRHALLDDVPLARALHIVERVGRSILDENLRMDRAQIKHGSGRLLAAGFHALENFPANFDLLLDELISRRDESDLKSLIKAYGPLRYWLGSQLTEADDCPLTQTLLKAIDDHAMINAVCPTRLIWEGKPVTGVPTVEVASRCDLAYNRFARLATEIGYDVPLGGPGNVPSVPPVVADEIVERIKSFRSMNEVATALGIRWQRVWELSDLGHLPYASRPYSREEPKGKRGDQNLTRMRERPGNTWYFEGDAAETFLERLRSMVKPKPGIPKSDLIELLRTTQMFTSTAKVIELVLDGTLPVREIDSSRIGMRGILVSESEARDILKGARREGYPLRAAAPKMGMNYNQLLSCIKTGLVSPAGSGSRLSLTDEMIEEFQRTFMLAKDIAIAFGVQRSAVAIRHLRDNGLEPIAVEGELQLTMYWRTEAEPLVKSLPPPRRFKNSRERMKYQKENGLEIKPTRQTYETPVDWNKRSNDRSGRRPT